MYVPSLDNSGTVADEDKFDLEKCLNVVQSIQEFRDKLTNHSDATTCEEKFITAAGGWVPKIGDLVQETIHAKQAFKSSYRTPITVHGVKGNITFILPPLLGSRCLYST